MLSRYPVIAEPDFIKCRVSAEEVDMPVGTLGRAHVVSQSGTYTSRPTCAADVDIESRLELQVAQPPDPDYRVRCR
jgi:hypothetical protein